ncbi:MAG: phage tail protein [Bacteroidetes bacterium]|nr:phage tail protein [Bacteroidota bacterium]
MKKFSLTIVAAIIACASIFAQNSGVGFNYQAVVRVGGEVLANQQVELRFSLMPGQSATTAAWIERHIVTTDNYGIVGVTVGKGTRTGGSSSTFAGVNFASAQYWLKVEINENGTYRELSYTALPSVPYAEVANNAAAIPPGTIVAFGGTAIPTGWLLCDGRSFNRTAYPALFAAIGTAWGSTSTTTFNIPDLRGVFLRGVDGSATNDTDKATRTVLKTGGNSGNNVGSYQGDAIRNITGNINTVDRRPINWTGTGALLISDATNNNKIIQEKEPQMTGAANIGFDASKAPNVTVGSDNRPKNVYVHYIIKQ